MTSLHSDNPFWSDKRILVTGATGMVGSWLVEHLVNSGGEVTAFIHDFDYRSHFFRSGVYQYCANVRGDLRVFSDVERAIAVSGADSVIHLGAQTIVGTALRSPLQTFEANVRGSYNLLEACRLHREQIGRIVLASSDKAYGDNQGLPYDEDGPLQAQHPYDVSKLCGDMIARAYAHTYGLPVAIARCGNIYGGGDLNWSRIVPGTIRALTADERPVIRSDGHYTRDYFYVKDAVTAYLRLAQFADRDGVRGEAFNFSGDSPLSVLEIVQVISRLMHRDHLAPVIKDVARYEIRHQVVTSTKARDVLGWMPNYDLEIGIAETIAWYGTFLRQGPKG